MNYPPLPDGVSVEQLNTVGAWLLRWGAEAAGTVLLWLMLSWLLAWGIQDVARTLWRRYVLPFIRARLAARRGSTS